MGLPGKRLSRSSKRRRAAHFAIHPQTLIECAKCKKKILPHRVCAYCGSYKGRDVVQKKSKTARTTARTQTEEKQKE